jgi:hypothetical protein
MISSSGIQHWDSGTTARISSEQDVQDDRRRPENEDPELKGVIPEYEDPELIGGEDAEPAGRSVPSFRRL